MKKVKTSIPAKRIRRDYYFLALLAVVLIAASSWLIFHRAQQVIRERSREELQARAESCAQVVAGWRVALRAEMIALAEQRGMRQGLAAINVAMTSKEWRAGFIQAADAVCRAFPAGEAGVRNFTLRSLDGRRIAGTGTEVEQVLYPDIMQRIQIQTFTSGNGNISNEKWIVPVRDAEARPLAFLVAQVSPTASMKALLHSNIIGENDLLCLEDSSGVRLWDSKESVKIPGLDAHRDQFQAEDKMYYLALANVPETGWTLGLATIENGAHPNLRALAWSSILYAVLAAILLCLFLLFLSKAARKILSTIHIM